MKKLLLGGLLGVTVSIAAVAAATSPGLTSAASVKKNQSNESVCLYPESNKGASCIKTISVTTPFVRITQLQNNPKWVKVGLHDRTGTVGWINLDQYHQAQKAFYQPDIQTVFIHLDHNRQGKPTYSIVAYKNGQKVSDEQARAFYNKVRHEQRTVFNRAQTFERRFNRMFDRDLMGSNSFFFNDAPSHFRLPPLGSGDQNQG